MEDKIRLSLSEEDNLLTKRYYQVCIMCPNQRVGFQAFADIIFSGTPQAKLDYPVPSLIRSIAFIPLDRQHRFPDLWHMEFVLNLSSALQIQLNAGLDADYSNLDWGEPLIDLPRQGIPLFPYSDTERYSKEEIYLFLQPKASDAYPSAIIRKSDCKCEKFPHQLDCPNRLAEVVEDDDDECYFPQHCQNVRPKRRHTVDCELERCNASIRHKQIFLKTARQTDTLRNLSMKTIGEHTLFWHFDDDKKKILKRPRCADGFNCPKEYSHDILCQEKQMREKQAKAIYDFKNRKVRNAISKVLDLDKSRISVDRSGTEKQSLGLWDLFQNVNRYLPFQER